MSDFNRSLFDPRAKEFYYERSGDISCKRISIAVNA